ncbi:MAG: hypothetical protein P4L45_15760 [Ignavibacteriaceae bacterium]|nr:hypothetical protein [Ignavibacteriaceae bacterium]
MKLIIKRNVSAFIISILILSSNYAQNINPFSIVGNWESVSNENNRMRIIRFESDSTFYAQTALSAEYSYIIVGNKMIAELLHSTKHIIDTTDVVIKKDTLISTLRRNGNDEVTTMVKIPDGLSDTAGIAGNYKWRYPNAHTAFSKFTKEGSWIFRLPIETIKGSYKISSDYLTITYAGMQPENMKCWVSDKVLILTDEKTGKEDLYRKVDYFIKD